MSPHRTLLDRFGTVDFLEPAVDGLDTLEVSESGGFERLEEVVSRNERRLLIEVILFFRFLIDSTDRIIFIDVSDHETPRWGQDTTCFGQCPGDVVDETDRRHDECEVGASCSNGKLFGHTFYKFNVACACAY